MTANRVRESEGEWLAAKGPRPGLEPWAAAARTKPLYMNSDEETELLLSQTKLHLDIYE